MLDDETWLKPDAEPKTVALNGIIGLLVSVDEERGKTVGESVSGSVKESRTVAKPSDPAGGLHWSDVGSDRHQTTLVNEASNHCGIWVSKKHGSREREKIWGDWMAVIIQTEDEISAGGAHHAVARANRAYPWVVDREPDIWEVPVHHLDRVIGAAIGGDKNLERRRVERPQDGECLHQIRPAVPARDDDRNRHGAGLRAAITMVIHKHGRRPAPRNKGSVKPVSVRSRVKVWRLHNLMWPPSQSGLAWVSHFPVRESTRFLR